MCRPVDPSLFLERFVRQLECMSGASNQAVNAVQNTALRLVKSMKRDWMQTGRRPSGICGAAIFIACHIHGGAAAESAAECCHANGCQKSQ